MQSIVIYSRFIEVCICAYGTIFGWWPEMNVYLCLLSVCYCSMVSTGESTGTLKPYQSLHWSLLDILLGSLLNSLIQCLLQSLLERATLESWCWEIRASESVKFSTGCFWLMTISEFVEALTLTLTKLTYLSTCFWYYDHHHQHHDQDTLWDLIVVGAINIRFTLKYQLTLWFRPLYATHCPHPPPASWYLVGATLPVSGWSTQKHTWEHIVRWDWECLASWEWTWEHRAK